MRRTRHSQKQIQSAIYELHEGLIALVAQQDRLWDTIDKVVTQQERILALTTGQFPFIPRTLDADSDAASEAGISDDEFLQAAVKD